MVQYDAQEFELFPVVGPIVLWCDRVPGKHVIMHGSAAMVGSQLARWRSWSNYVYCLN